MATTMAATMGMGMNMGTLKSKSKSTRQLRRLEQDYWKAIAGQMSEEVVVEYGNDLSSIGGSTSGFPERRDTDVPLGTVGALAPAFGSDEYVGLNRDCIGIK